MVENVRREMIDLKPVCFFQQQYMWYWVEESTHIYSFSNIELHCSQPQHL